MSRHQHITEFWVLTSVGIDLKEKKSVVLNLFVIQMRCNTQNL